MDDARRMDQRCYRFGAASAGIPMAWLALWTGPQVVVTVFATVAHVAILAAAPQRALPNRWLQPRVLLPMKQPNVVYVLADQLRARSLPAYGERQIATPNIDRIVREGIRFTNAVATCPLCAPYRSMLVTGREPLETGHIINNLRARHDEISIADAFNHAGYRTGWGSTTSGPTTITPSTSTARCVSTTAAMSGGGGTKRPDYCRTSTSFSIRRAQQREPFCLFVAPHMPHHGGAIPGGRVTQDASPNGRLAPDDCLRRVPEPPVLPANLPPELLAEATDCYRDYLAMTVAVDDMLGAVLRRLRRDGLLDNTIVVFGSDHGSLMGAHGLPPWQKRTAWEESVSVPLAVRLPGGLRAGSACEALVAPVDLFPTLCGLCGIDVPRTVSGRGSCASGTTPCSRPPST